MEVGCLTYLGAFTIGQLLNETALKAGKSWKLSHEPPVERGTHHSQLKVERWREGSGKA